MMNRNPFILLPVFAIISYLSIPGALGIVPANAYSILIQRLLASFILLNIVIYNYNQELLKSIINTSYLNAKGMGLVVVVMFFLSVVCVQNKLMISHSDIFRISWTYSLVAFYFISSAIYYLLYEITFRGIFLMWLTKRYSLPLAVSFNVLVYAYMHLPKSITEAIACIPFGLLLCIATIRSHSVLPAIIMHLVLGIYLEGVTIYQINNTK